MTDASELALPSAPPAHALAQLDVAVAALDALALDGAFVTLARDERSGSLRIELVSAGGSRPLRPTELFDLLA